MRNTEYVNAETAEKVTDQKEAVAWFNEGVNVKVYARSGKDNTRMYVTSWIWESEEYKGIQIDYLPAKNQYIVRHSEFNAYFNTLKEARLFVDVMDM